MDIGEKVTSILRAVSNCMQVPVIIVLLLLIAAALILVGVTIVEYLMERKKLEVNLPELVDRIKYRAEKPEILVEKSGLLFRQKKALYKMIEQSMLDEETLEALAARILFEEKTHYQRRLLPSEMIERLGPMFGLLGTLIPLGPGILALSQGDTYTLSMSLLTAFDTTVAGLLSAAVAFVITIVRKRWYQDYMSSLELLMETILGVLYDGKRKV